MMDTVTTWESLNVFEKSDEGREIGQVAAVEVRVYCNSEVRPARNVGCKADLEGIWNCHRCSSLNVGKIE